MTLQNIEINGIVYKYNVIKRRGIKNIRLKINKDGIINISLPWYIPKIEAQKFLIKNTKWLEKNFTLLNKQKDKYFYLGSNIKIIEITDSKYLSIDYYLKEDIFYIKSNGAIKIDKQQIYHKWLKNEAEKFIVKETEKIAFEHGFKYNQIKIKDMKSRWGSCSTKKNLSFNLKLMYFKPKIIEYVIVHELCHLKEMNHSKNFWLLVENIIPNYKTCRKKIKYFFL
jgi:predicted metal-dependent hydrolase